MASQRPLHHIQCRKYDSRDIYFLHVIHWQVMDSNLWSNILRSTLNSNKVSSTYLFYLPNETLRRSCPLLWGTLHVMPLNAPPVSIQRPIVPSVCSTTISCNGASSGYQIKWCVMKSHTHVVGILSGQEAAAKLMMFFHFKFRVRDEFSIRALGLTFSFALQH